MPTESSTKKSPITMERPTSTQEAISRYRTKLKEQEVEIKSCDSSWGLIGTIRGLLLLASIVFLIAGCMNAFELSFALLGLSAITFVIFVVVAIYHEQLQQRIKRARLLATMHRESIARIERRWQDIKVPKVDVPEWFAPTSKDLDLLSSSSIYKLLGTPRTPLGTQTLTQWIIEGALKEEVEQRQHAVNDLKPLLDWRQDFRLKCEYLGDSQSGPSRFIHWCESKSWFANQAWILWTVRATTATSIFAIICLLTGILPIEIAAGCLIGSCGINFLAAVFRSGSIHDVFNQISSRSNDANRYVELFDMVAELTTDSQKLKSLQACFQQGGEGAQYQMKQLSRLVFLANFRRSGLFFILYVILEVLFFWDVHALDWLESWKKRTGQDARQWFENLGQFEALVALAKLAADEPTWTFPEISDSQPGQVMISGKQVGHPLLPSERVSNDVQVGPPGTVLLVTGSNMSGKSTLLRSIGANVVLAQMGSVVCADSFSTPPLRIETSMRIADSLADGVSFFMAELKRLKQIVDTASEHCQNSPRQLLFLLDEILQGTNSRERQIAVSRVVRKLIDEQAIGAISTHDLDLAHTAELAKACQTVHFSEQFKEVDGKKVMTFDYQMKPGIAETTNALKLLELVGLSE